MRIGPYKGYYANVMFMEDDGGYHYGRLILDGDVVDFTTYSDTTNAIESSFQEAVDDYLKMNVQPANIYTASQALSPIKVGDSVKILRTAESGEFGWDFRWVAAMNEMVGKVGIVQTVDPLRGFAVKFDNWKTFEFPYFVLERVPSLKLTDGICILNPPTFIHVHGERIESGSERFPIDEAFLERLKLISSRQGELQILRVEGEGVDVYDDKGVDMVFFLKKEEISDFLAFFSKQIAQPG